MASRIFQKNPRSLFSQGNLSWILLSVLAFFWLSKEVFWNSPVLQTSGRQYSDEILKLNKLVSDLKIQNEEILSSMNNLQVEKEVKDKKSNTIKKGEDIKRNDLDAYNSTYKRKTFPEIDPTICLAFLSCRRYDLLSGTIRSILDHIEKYEPELKYEIAIVDNGAVGTTFQEDILGEFQVEKFVQTRVNYGIAFGLNSLFFGLCRAPYVLSMEDDWLWVEERSKKRPILSNAIKVLEENGDHLGVTIRQSYTENWKSDVPWQVTKAGDVEFKTLTGQPGTHQYYIYSNAGMILSRSNLKKIGPHQPEGVSSETEPTYKDSAFSLGLKTAMLRLATDEECQNWEYVLGRYPTTDCQSCVIHTGGDRHVENIH